MLGLERRVTALEDSASDKALKVVIVLAGESQAAALVRVGLPPDTRAVYMSELDERL